MPNLAEELETWFKDRPLWLQDATSRLIKNSALDKSDYNDLLKICGNEAGVVFEGQVIPKAQPIPSGAFSSDVHSHHVEICSISDIIGVNALNPRNPFIIPDGLTVIYGQNGSGKSGYTRLLKQICGAKNLGRLYPNTFEEKPSNQSCKIEYRYENRDCELNWDITQGINEQLSGIELYDADCGSVYVTNENQLAYEPPLLRIFSDLTSISDNISYKLDGLLINLVSAKPMLPSEYALTKLGRWYKTINATTEEKIIGENCSWSEKNLKTLDALKLRQNTTDPKAEAKKVRKSKIELDKLIKVFDDWKSKLSDNACDSYLALKKDFSIKQEAALEYAKNIFKNSPLTGIGEEAWTLLWEHARKYSKNIAYPQKKFPNIEDESVCVLCQQPLKGDAKKRLSGFENFVKGELELAAKNAKNALEKIEESLSNPPDEDSVATMISASGLADDISQKVLVLYASIVEKSEELLKTEINKEFTAGIDFTILDGLIVLSEDMETTAKQFDEDAKKDKSEEIEEEIIEFETRKWLSQQKEAILAEMVLLDKKAKITKAKSSVNTAALTRKKSSIAERLVTAKYIQRFKNEIKVLGAGRIGVKIEKTRADKGRVYFQVKLDGNKLGVPVDEILSEGEFRIISLATFLADVEGHEDKSTFIFDDPISSLDQDYEENVAKRLVELSKSRQVLVFTHRLSLMALLEEANKKQGLVQSIIGLYKESWGTGEPGLSPILAQKTKAAINTLISKISAGKKIINEKGKEEYSWWAKGVCSNVRITVEKIIEYDLLADVVKRFRRSITTQGKLHNIAKVTTEDCIYIDDLMTKYSRYEHSQPDEVPVPLPEPDELKTDLNQLKEWRDNFIKR